MAVLLEGLSPLPLIELNEALPCLGIGPKLCCCSVRSLGKIDLVLFIERKGPEDVA